MLAVGTDGGLRERRMTSGDVGRHVGYCGLCPVVPGGAQTRRRGPRVGRYRLSPIVTGAIISG